VTDAERPSDPELARLLLLELERHAKGLSEGHALGEQRRAIHALKGSAALAGERGFADALARVERRLADGDEDAVRSARALVLDAQRALAEGLPIPVSTWPEPPDDLRVSPSVAPAAPYASQMRDRIERIDEALAAPTGDLGAAAAAYREVHAMKGAALAVGDEVTAWFCHGLEERLRMSVRSEGEAARGLAELARFRPLLGELLVAPERALEALRLAAGPGRSSSPPSTEALRDRPSTVEPQPPSMRHRSSEGSSETDLRSVMGEETLRVPTATLDRMFERVRQIAQVRAEVTGGAALVETMAARARQLRSELSEALRLIGPPRPWGAPAAAIGRIEAASREVAVFAEQLEREASMLKDSADRVRTESAAAHGELAQIRTTRVAWLFERVAAATIAEARREGREVRFSFAGGESTVDRRIAELLFDPVLQLARNAVAHGIEPVAERALRGKPRVGLIRLSAEARSGGLRLVVHDDGAGVNVGDVRLRAVAKGTVSAEVARTADDETLLALLFVPGFTTRESADLLAGRGVGLDIALEAVQRLGGTIRLASEPGMGVTATLDIPFEPGLVKVLWVDAGAATYALPVQHAQRISLARDTEDRAIPLAALVGDPSQAGAPSAHPFAIELDAKSAGARTTIAVDAVGSVEEVALHGVSQIITSAGPFAGAIVRGEELRLCLDGHALVDRARRAAQTPR
jgi:two-component system, chemotaxis family, sensor kinase CheA